MVEPQGYLDFLCLMKNARMVVTDSGGIQEETTALGVSMRHGSGQYRTSGHDGIGTNLLRAREERRSVLLFRDNLSFAVGR